MKVITNIIITHILFLTLFAGAAFALAQETETTIDDPVEVTTEEVTADSSATPEERRAALEQKMQDRQASTTERQAQLGERRADVQENIAERKVALQVRVQERITNLAANMSNRMEAVIKRFQNIIDRTDSRIGKLNERGVDISNAKESLASAQASVDAAAAIIANIDTEVTLAIGGEDARAGWQSVKGIYTQVRDHLKTAHSELRATVAALKAAVAEEGARGVSDAVRANQETATEVEDSSN